jgi:hypothetical protein
MSSLAEFKAENKNTNYIILNKLDTQNEILIRFSTSFENHIAGPHNPNPCKKTYNMNPKEFVKTFLPFALASQTKSGINARLYPGTSCS